MPVGSPDRPLLRPFSAHFDDTPTDRKRSRSSASGAVKCRSLPLSSGNAIDLRMQEQPL